MSAWLIEAPGGAWKLHDDDAKAATGRPPGITAFRLINPAAEEPVQPPS